MDGHQPLHSRLERGSSDPAHHRWQLSRIELLLIFAFWTFLALLTAANRVLDPRGPGFQPGLPSGPVALAFTEFYLWALLTPLIFWLSSRFSIERSNRVARILLFVGVGVIVAVFVDVLVDFFRTYVFPIPRRRPFGFTPLRGITRLWFLDELIVYFAVLAAGFARDYFLRYRARQEEAVRLQSQTAALQAQLAEARLDALRMQIDPHFLFNTLHAISTLVERDPRGVRRMIARLSELLRHTLNGTNEQEVPLEQELDFLRRYLEIMQIRFQGRLEIEMQVEPGVLDALVPSLILQPLVENAVKHGVSHTVGIGRIEIRAQRKGDRLVVGGAGQWPGLGRASGVGRVGGRRTA